MLIAESFRRAQVRGYRHGEMSWTLEDNDLINSGIEALGVVLPTSGLSPEFVDGRLRLRVAR